MAEGDVMDVQFVTSVAVITPDVSVSRGLYVDALGLPLTGEGEDYLHSEDIDGCTSFGVWPLTQAAQACFGMPDRPSERPVDLQSCGVVFGMPFYTLRGVRSPLRLHDRPRPVQTTQPHGSGRSAPGRSGSERNGAHLFGTTWRPGLAGLRPSARGRERGPLSCASRRGVCARRRTWPTCRQDSR